MDLRNIFEMQKALDDHIRGEHDLYDEYLVTEKILALLVELGELANETRCFKYWSNKPPSERKVIMEEYVDGLHFILSLCIDKEINMQAWYLLRINYVPNRDLSLDFLDLYDSVIQCYNSFESEGVLIGLLDQYVSFGIKLGFSWSEIEQAYIDKNAVNHQRQESGY